MKKQVDKSQYEFAKYVDKRRWASIWHQVDEVLKRTPKRVLEVGPGPGVFKALAGAFHVHVETLDLDPELKPDHCVSVFEMPFKENAFDVVCAFQMLEHLPFEESIAAFNEMARVARTAVVISLPNAAIRWPISIYIPKVGPINFSIQKPRLHTEEHKFDGEHYWEINKTGYSVETVIEKLSLNADLTLTKNYRVDENPYHHFFVFEKRNT